MESVMDEDVFNIQLRKFLKKVGIQSQREIEQAVREGIASGALQGNETLNASVRLQLGETDLDITIKDDIKLA
tara:strand:+ start:249 stop:467 length:219 start_codon:yes stop_codon:yes gene_type:complete